MVKDIEATWSFDSAGPVISSFSADVLRLVRKRSARLPIGVLVWKDKTIWPGLAGETGAMSVHFSRRNLTKSEVAEAVGQGLAVAVYTVNDPAEAKKLLGWGVTGLCTDDPGGILAAIGG